MQKTDKTVGYRMQILQEIFARFQCCSKALTQRQTIAAWPQIQCDQTCNSPQVSPEKQQTITKKMTNDHVSPFLHLEAAGFGGGNLPVARHS
jgi:hypothetical protein